MNNSGTSTKFNFSKSTIKFFALACVALSISLTSCDKEGPQGPIGPTGIDGINGSDGNNGANGTDGNDGTSGTNGTNGTNGQDGEDGNANVTSSSHDISSASGTSHRISTQILTADNVENGVILAYLRVGTEWYQIPNQRIFTNGFSLIDVSSYFDPTSSGNAYFYNLGFLRDGAPVAIGAGDLDELRFVAIPSTSSTSGKSSSNSELDRLYDNGIDLTDYHQVMKFYDLN